MELSAEDSLRMHVLLTQQLQVIRIDESKMIVYGLSDRGEAKVELNPNCRDEQYIKLVKDFISTQVLGSPGGYPIYLRRWTRMGQAKHDSLERLLQLGEAEAIIAVVHAESLTNELARRAWWAMQSSDNARCMLERDLVANGEMGGILAEFLVEFLPFEEEPKAMLDSVRLVLKPNLISAETKGSLWKRGQRKNAFLVGFMRALPDELPLDSKPHSLYMEYSEKLEALKDNQVAQQLVRCLSSQGQAFFKTAVVVLKKPGNQDVVIELITAISNYFEHIKPIDFIPSNSFEILPLKAKEYIATEKCDYTKEIAKVVEVLPESIDLLESMLVLSQLDIHLVNPIFSRTDAMGTVMRKKLTPVFEPITDYVAKLIK